MFQLSVAQSIKKTCMPWDGVLGYPPFHQFDGTLRLCESSVLLKNTTQKLFLFQLRKVWIGNVKFQLNAQNRISFFPPQMTDIISSTVIPFHIHTIQHVGICETLTTYVSVRPSVIQKIFIRVSSPLVRHKVSYNRDTKITVIHINTTDNYMLHAKSLQHIRQTKKKCILKITLQRWVSVLNHFLLYNKNKSQHDESWSRVNCNSPKLTTRASQKPETWAVSLLTVTKIGAG